VRTVYFDYNATTPLDPDVREAMLPHLTEIYGNPSSVHHIGRRARSVLDEARERVAQVWRCKPSEVVFTSGGTESTNLALFGTARALREKGRHIITTSVEHHAVLHACEYLVNKEGLHITFLPVDTEGRVHVDAVKAAIRPDTILVSVMAANNEIGTIQPVSQIGEVCRQKGVLFHTDAVQVFGKEPFDGMRQFNADLVSVCAHKFHGPKGAGALFVRSPLRPEPIIFGGRHENEQRAGTENLAGIVGFAEATERFVQVPVFKPNHIKPLTDKLMNLVRSLGKEGVTLRTPNEGRLANTVAFTVKGSDSMSLLAGLDLEGICASSGSACSSGSLEPSHVMVALGIGKNEANSLVRFSLGRESSLEEVAQVERCLPEIIRRVQQFQQTPKER
jgi:cysteine desulfurase